MHKEDIPSEEIPLEEVHRYASELRDVVEAICASAPFRTSPKSCEFLRHIVHHTLRGSTDELKERLIGIALLGRETTYDTGSDAGVRVRANDVRKRLNTFNSANEESAAFTLNLPAGSYLPRFFRRTSATAEPSAISVPTLVHDAPPALETLPVPHAEQSSAAHSLIAEPREQWAPLSLQQVAMPTLVALFLCTICIRWQLAQEHPFTTFWQTVLQDHHAVLYVPPSEASGRQRLISMQSLEETAPLLNLAGQFHAEFTLTNSAAVPASAGDILVSIGSSAPNANHFAVENTPAGREVVDLSTPNRHAPVAGRAALLTIANGPQRSIRIDGTDDGAIGSLIRTLCERNTFPEELADSFQSGTVTQLVFPMAAHTEAMVFHEPLPTTSATMAQNQ
jgi:hypothetical protein